MADSTYQRQPEEGDYTYQPLEDDQHSIRLLHVHPAVPADDFDAPLVCDLRTTKLSDNQRYAALSYTWGPPWPPVFDMPILLDSRLFYTTRNLIFALCSLRGFGRRIVWVDAICINQADPVEKSRQIPLLYPIFSGASRVYAHLREGGSEGRTAMQLMWVMVDTLRCVHPRKSDPNRSPGEPSRPHLECPFERTAKKRLNK